MKLALRALLPAEAWLYADRGAVSRQLLFGDWMLRAVSHNWRGLSTPHATGQEQRLESHLTAANSTWAFARGSSPPFTQVAFPSCDTASEEGPLHSTSCPYIQLCCLSWLPEGNRYGSWGFLPLSG